MTDDHIVDGTDSSDDDSVILNAPPVSGLLQIRQTGAVTIVGLTVTKLRADHNIADCRSEVAALIAEHKCEEFVFDLTGVQFVPSGALGLINSIRNLDVKAVVLNPPPQVRLALEVKRLDTFVELRDEIE